MAPKDSLFQVRINSEIKKTIEEIYARTGMTLKENLGQYYAENSSKYIRCKKCNDVIESTNRHDFRSCQCGAVAVDGGKDYLRRCGERADWEELSEYENV